MRFFNTTGPVTAERRYCIPPLDRMDLAEVRRLVAEDRCFVLHAPRQTGKTSALLALQDLLNQEGRHRCVYVDRRGRRSWADKVFRRTRQAQDGTRVQVWGM